MSMMDLMLDRRSTSLSNIAATFDATHIITTDQYVAFHFTSAWFGDDKALQLFDEEVAILRSVRHPWLLTPTEVIEDDRERLLCYKPFTPGPVLAKQWGELDDDTLLPLFEGLSEMAAMFHMKGAFCYFDPADLFVSSPLKVQWLRLPRAFLTATTMPATGGIFGSPGFRSPGQVRGDAMQPADDFFVLGAMLLAAKAGIQPFHSDKPSDSLIKIIEGDPAGLDADSVTPGFRDLIERLLRQDEAKRLIDPDEIYERLQVAFGKAPFVPTPEASDDDDANEDVAEDVVAEAPPVEAPPAEAPPAEDVPAEDVPTENSPAEVVDEAAPDLPESPSGEAVEKEEPATTEVIAEEKEPVVEEVAAGKESEGASSDAPETDSSPALPEPFEGDMGEAKKEKDEAAKEPATEAKVDAPAPVEEVSPTPEPDVEEAEAPPAPVVVADETETPVPEAPSEALTEESEEVEEGLSTEAQADDEAGEAPVEVVQPARDDALPTENLKPPSMPPAGLVPSAFTPPPPSRTSTLTPPPLPSVAAPPVVEDATQDTSLSPSTEEVLTEAEEAQLKKAQKSARRLENKKKRKKKPARTGTTGIFAGLIEEAFKADQEAVYEDDPEPTAKTPPLEVLDAEAAAVPVVEEASETPEAPEAPETPKAPETPEALEASEAPDAPALADAGTSPRGRRATVAFGEPMPELKGAMEALLPPARDESESLEEESLALLEPMAPDKGASGDTAQAGTPLLSEQLPAKAEPAESLAPPAPPAPVPMPVPPKGAKTASPNKPGAGPSAAGKSASAPQKISLRKQTGPADTLITGPPIEVKPPVIELPVEFESASDLDALPGSPSPLDDLAAPVGKEPSPVDDVDVALNEMADIDGDFDEFSLDESVDGVRLDEAPAESTLKTKPPVIEPQVRSPKDGSLVPDEVVVSIDDPDAVLPPKEPILPAPTEDTVLSNEMQSAPTAKLPAPTVSLGSNASSDNQRQVTTAPLQRAVPEVEERKTKVLRRKGVVRYYKQMNPTKIFPLLVSILEAEMYIKVPEISGALQQESDKVMNIKESSPMVRIVPVIPGCLVSPAEAIVDVRQKKVDTEFWIAPQNVGDLERSARVQIWHDGELKDEIPLPIRVRKQTMTKITGSMSLFSTFGGAILKAYGSVQPATDKGFSSKVAQSVVGAFSATGMWLGVLFFLAALGCYFWLKPRKGDEVEMFLSSELH